MCKVKLNGARGDFRYLSILVGLTALIACHTAYADHCHADEVLLGSHVETEGNTEYEVDTCMKGNGPWTRDNLDVINRVLTSLPDTSEKRWLMGHVVLVRRHASDSSPIWAGRDNDGNAALIVNDRFFSSGTSDKVRRSLLAFEAGKVFYIRYDLEQWDARHMNNYRQSMMDMIAAGKAPNEPNADMFDRTSQFGGVFRVRMLKLPPKPEWMAALRELDNLVVRYASPDAP